MNMYDEHHKSTPQKLAITAIELILVAVAAWVLLSKEWSFLGWSIVAGDAGRRITLHVFNVVVFLRYIPTLFVFLRRRISAEESVSVPFAFALYFVGFALLGRGNSSPLGFAWVAGIALFVVGSTLNTAAEFQRHLFKAKLENAGRLYTGGFFSASMHINYLGDVLWVTGYALVTGNPFSLIIPVLLFCFFAFFNIPKLDTYLERKYGESFLQYRAQTRRFIPWLW